jgi:hypothetical protein
VPAAADCIGGWLEGEAQEFRDVVRRGIDEFQVSFDRFRRGLKQLLPRL